MTQPNPSGPPPLRPAALAEGPAPGVAGARLVTAPPLTSTAPAASAQAPKISPPQTPGTQAPSTQAPASDKSPRAASPAASAAAVSHVAPPVNASRMKRRHWLIVTSFVLMVLGPAAVTAWYLWERAADQYASTVAFSVRKEEATSAIELLGGITQLSGSSSSDTDILYEFIQSQKLVAEIDQDLDLRAIWSKPAGDPIFRYDSPGTIEDLVRHWARKVRIYYDSATGLIEVRALAFTPEDATAIAQAIYARSVAMINDLSDIARQDAIRYARTELDSSVERLKAARAAITEFRNRTQIVDPQIDLQTQAALLGNLEGQRATALIEVDVLDETTRPGDPRMEQARRRVRVIEDRIASERKKMGIGAGADSEQGQVYAELVGDYERLQVDLQFAERTYTGALAGYDSALAEAQRQTRYLAAYVLPTTAEKSQYPQREMLLGLITLFAFLLWAISVLVAYSLKDRR